MSKIEVTILRGTDGKVDVNGTLASWHNDLSVLAAKEEADCDTIALAVDLVWEQNPTLKSLNMNALASYAMRNIPNVSYQAYNEVSERIKNYVRNASGLYEIVKGKGGGVVPLARCNEEELARIDAQRSRAAEKASQKAA